METFWRHLGLDTCLDCSVLVHGSGAGPVATKVIVVTSVSMILATLKAMVLQAEVTNIGLFEGTSWRRMAPCQPAQQKKRGMEKSLHGHHEVATPG